MAKFNSSSTPWVATMHTTTNCSTCPTEITVGTNLDIQDCDAGDTAITTVAVRLKTVNGVLTLFVGEGSCD